MENIESPKGAEIENERSQNENLDTSMEVTEVQPTFSEIERVVSEYSELNETEKKQKVEKYLQRAKRSRDAWRTKIQAHNGRPCLGKGCTLCIEKAAYKNGKLETTKLSEAKFSKYFSSEDQNGYIHPDFYPSIKFQPKHNHCKNICCVCTRFPYLHGSNKELLEPVHKRRDEPLSETCIKCKGVAHLTCASPSKKRFEYFICSHCHQVEFMRFQPYKEKLQEGWKWLLTTENLRMVYLF